MQSVYVETIYTCVKFDFTLIENTIYVGNRY
jgi:hypothetical protein